MTSRFGCPIWLASATSPASSPLLATRSAPPSSSGTSRRTSQDETGPASPTVVGFGVHSERDPITGRTAIFDQTGPVVWEPDGSEAFRLAVPGAILAMLWSADGRLITVETDGREEVGTVRVTPWEPDGIGRASCRERVWIPV